MKLSNKRLFAGLALSSMLVLSACGTEAATTTEAEVDLNALTLSEIETQAKEEGHLVSEADEAQMAFEIHGLILALHYEARFLKDPSATERANTGFENILLRYGKAAAGVTPPTV